MEQMTVILTQLAKMFVYMCVGFILIRGGVIKKGESRITAQMLLYVFLPCTIVNSFYKGAAGVSAGKLFTSIIIGALALLIAMAGSAIFFRKRPIDNFSGAFSNAGFMGIPLIGLILGPENVIYIAGMVALLNALQWSYGQMILSGGRAGGGLTILKNPMIISFVLGLGFYFLPIRLPEIFETCLSGMAACNTPLAMILLGMYLGEAELKKVFSDGRMYLTALVRLLVIPLITLAVIIHLPADRNIIMSVLLAASAPVGSNVAIYAQKLGLDHTYAAGVVCVSTVLCIVTIPLIIFVSAL